MDWIHRNNETICGKTSSKLVLKEVNVWKSDSSALIQAMDSLDKSVERLSIRETFSSEIPNKLFESFENLKHLNLSNNNLTKFDSKLLFSANNRLISLDLSLNHLNSIDLKALNSLEILNISNNSLNSIQKFSHRFKSISLENNDWNCSEELVWLLKYTTDLTNNVLQRDRIRCESPESAKEMTFSQRLSALETPVCSQCECLLRTRDVMSVNCSQRGLHSLPSSLPSITKILRLENNEIKNISVNLVSMNDWRNVSYLYLNNNSIESFVGLERTNLLKSLVALHISHNRLREIPIYILDQLSHLDELYLSDNPWQCNCKTIVFQTWLQDHFKSIKDVYNIRCAASDHTLSSKPKNGLYSEDFDNRFSNKILLRIPKSELCPQSQEPIEVFEIINWLLSSLILMIIIKLIYDYFWQKRTGKLPQFFRLNVN